MFKFLSPESLARFSAKHPWYMVGLWVLILVGAFMGAGMAKTDNASESGNTEAQRAFNALERARGEAVPEETIVITSASESVDSPAYRDFVTNLAAEVRGLEGVESAATYYETNDPAMVSRNGQGTMISVLLAGDEDDAMDTVLPLLHLIEDTTSDEGFTVRTVGAGSLNYEIGEIAKSDLQKSEILGLPAAAIVLIIVFGALVAAGLPLMLSMLAIFVATGITGVLSTFVPMGEFVENMVIMIGLAVGIDYSLFIIERFREERAAGLDKVEAITRTGATASRAVLFSGLTVILALASLLIMPDTFFHGLSLGAVAAAVGALAAAMTLLPAALSLLGDKVNAFHLPGRGKPSNHAEATHGFWHRTTSAVMKHPVIAVVATVAILGAAAAPLATIELGSSGISQLPQNAESVRAFNTLQDEFTTVRIAPVDVVIEGDVSSSEVNAAVASLAASVAQNENFTSMTELEVLDERTALVQIYIKGDSMGDAAQKAVKQLRSEYLPSAFGQTGVSVLVGGGTAENVDYVDSMTKYLPLVIGFVLALSFLLLMVVFRSIVIPVKAILMNLLSVAAAYGLIVLVFQHGVGAETLGLTETKMVAAWLPVFLFAILFGLSMDYHVFLLSRIQERYLKTGDNRASVASGLQSTAHIITGAAAIMVVVFGAFALGDLIELQQMGFGLAVAVFIDATLVRSILVPASMELLGDRNWYLPSWLEWLPRLNVEGAPAPSRQPVSRPSAGRIPGNAIPVEVRIND